MDALIKLNYVCKLLNIHNVWIIWIGNVVGIFLRNHAENGIVQMQAFYYRHMNNVKLWIPIVQQQEMDV